MFNAHKEDKNEVRESGMLGRSRCPDCRKQLASLSKIDTEEEVGLALGERARVCVNLNCWRYTDLSAMPSWKRNMRYEQVIKALELKIKAN